MPRQLVVPDVLAVIQTGIPQSDVARIRKLSGVRGVLTVSGGAIKIGGKTANVIGVDPAAFRSWTPVAAAGDQALWQALARGQFVTGDRRAAHPGPGPRATPTRSRRPPSRRSPSAGPPGSASPAWTRW